MYSTQKVYTNSYKQLASTFYDQCIQKKKQFREFSPVEIPGLTDTVGVLASVGLRKVVQTFSCRQESVGEVSV